MLEMLGQRQVQLLSLTRLQRMVRIWVQHILGLQQEAVAIHTLEMQARI